MFVLVHGSGLSYMLCRSLDSRLGALSGAVVSCGGLLAAGYANAVWQLCLAQGVLVGFGAAISTSAAVDVLDGVVLPRAVEEMLGGSAIITAAIGVGGGALSLCARQLAVTSSSSGIALRWLALVVFCGQLLGVVFMKGCADQGNCDGTLSDVDEDAAVCFDAQDVKADCCSGHMHRPDLSLDKPAPGTSLVGESRFGSMRRACTRVLETAQRAFGSRKLAASFLTDVLHHLGAFVPLMFLPGYVSTQLNNSQPLSGAVFLAIICFASAAGSLIGSFVASMIPAHVGLWQCASRLGLSLSVWCLWLPAADSWAMVYAFSLVYGLLLGSTNSASCSSLLDLDLAAARIRACGCCAAVLVGVPAAGCLFIGTELGDYYVPTVTFVASTSLLAAAVDAVTWWVLQRQEQ
ncbi:hypothetical protein GGI07_001524 [Coemansia sp. Benny D115]|nr:hypothetical protein GGI07_001524 [Coemansia sp. Benny D115]